MTRKGLMAAVCLVAAGALAGLASASSGTRADGATVLPPEPVLGSGPVTVPSLVVRARPASSSPAVAVLREFRTRDFRPQFVLATRRALGPDGRTPWVRISVPGRPNGRTGWVPERHVQLAPVAWQLVVRRETRRLELWNGERLVRTFPVAVGAPGMETPLGLFYVTARFVPTTQPILGAYAFETSAYSRLTDWPGGGVVGLHGTPWPELLGRAVSHGCVRVANETANFLRERIRVGTPIRVVRA